VLQERGIVEDRIDVDGCPSFAAVRCDRLTGEALLQQLAEAPPLAPGALGGLLGIPIGVAVHRVVLPAMADAAFAEADVVVEDKFTLHRYSSTPIETYGVIADYDESSDSMTIWSNFHGPFILHRVVSAALGIPQNQLYFVVPPDIGGSFGIKSAVYPYMALMGIASRVVGRPVKWIEDRIEHLLASSSGTFRIAKVRAAFRRDGELIGLDYRFIDDVG
jgi:2-furoyl-CoA dehydrogenase large subunit